MSTIDLLPQAWRDEARAYARRDEEPYDAIHDEDCPCGSGLSYRECHINGGPCHFDCQCPEVEVIP